eukprot:Clim_evm49s235 gene=Clim_evmTU49s235
MDSSSPHNSLLSPVSTERSSMAPLTFVTLLKNDGTFDVRSARTFRIDTSLSLEEAAKRSWEHVYKESLPAGSVPRLYTDLGVLIDDLEFLPPGQMLVCSAGEPFIRHNVNNRFSTNAVDDGTLSGDIGNILDDVAANAWASQAVALSEPGAAAPVWDTIQSTLRLHDRESQNDEERFWNFFSELDRSSNNDKPDPVPSENDEENADSPSDTHDEGAKEREQMFQNMNLPVITPNITRKRENTEETVDDEGDSETKDVPKKAKKRTAGEPKQGRMERHKAAEERSRQKLQKSIKELALTLPGANDGKQPLPRHELIKRAADFIREAQSREKKFSEQRSLLAGENESVKNKASAATLFSVEMIAPDHTLIYVDHTWEIVMGYTFNEVVGKRAVSIGGCHLCPLYKSALQQAAIKSALKEPWHGLLIGRRKNGQALTCEATIAPVTSPMTGELIHYVCTRKNFHILSEEEFSKLESEKAIPDSVHEVYQNRFVDSDI